MLCNFPKLNTVRSFVEKHTGLYSKKGCIETATDIGKELVDMQKSGKIITVQDLLTQIQAKAPRVTLPNTATGEDELVSLMRKYGMNELDQKKAVIELINNEKIGGAFSKYIKGIYIRQNFPIETKKPGIYGHELEHYIEYYNNPQTVIKNIIDKLNPKKILAKKEYDKRLREKLNSPHREEFIEQNLDGYKKHNQKKSMFENLFYKGFGLDGEYGIIPETGIIEGFSSTSKGVEEFLKSKAYNGLSNTKRIDAYIRGIIRHYIHPKATNIKTLKQMRDSFYREANAYQVNDNIARYYSNSDELTASKIVSEIHKRAGKIMDNEIKLAKKYKIKELKEHIMENIRKEGKIPKRVKKRGLPTSAVVMPKQD